MKYVLQLNIEFYVSWEAILQNVITFAFCQTAMKAYMWFTDMILGSLKKHMHTHNKKQAIRVWTNSMKKMSFISTKVGWFGKFEHTDTKSQ